jgi:hypothetical protein
MEYEPGIPNRTVRVSHVWLYVQFTTHTTRPVKKINGHICYICNNKKNCLFSSLFHTFSRHSCPQDKSFFSSFKKQTKSEKQKATIGIQSSPGVVKGTRPVPPWPKDLHTTVGELQTNDLTIPGERERIH